MIGKLIAHHQLNRFRTQDADVPQHASAQQHLAEARIIGCGRIEAPAARRQRRHVARVGRKERRWDGKQFRCADFVVGRSKPPELFLCHAKRSEESRGGKEGVSACRNRWWSNTKKKKKK